MSWIPAAIECLESGTIDVISFGNRLREFRGALSDGRRFGRQEQDQFRQLLGEMKSQNLLHVLWSHVNTSVLDSAPTESTPSIQTLFKLCVPFAPPGIIEYTQPTTGGLPAARNPPNHANSSRQANEPRPAVFEVPQLPAPDQEGLGQKGENGWFYGVIVMLGADPRCIRVLRSAKSQLKITQGKDERQLAHRVAHLILAVGPANSPKRKDIHRARQKVIEGFGWLEVSSVWSRWDVEKSRWEDPTEFLYFLLNSPIFPFKEIGNNLRHLYAIQSLCLGCGARTSEARPQHIFNLPIDHAGGHVADLIAQQYATPELLRADSTGARWCEECGSIQTHIRLDTVHRSAADRGLLLWVQRAELDDGKVNAAINVPTERFLLLCLSDDAATPSTCTPGLFFSRVILHHSGTNGEGGEWVCYVRDDPDQEFRTSFLCKGSGDPSSNIPGEGITLIYLEPCALPSLSPPPTLPKRVAQALESSNAKGNVAQLIEVVPLLLQLLLSHLESFFEVIGSTVSGQDLPDPFELLALSKRFQSKSTDSNDPLEKEQAFRVFVERHLENSLSEMQDSTHDMLDLATKFLKPSNFRGFLDGLYDAIYEQYRTNVAERCDQKVRSLVYQHSGQIGHGPLVISPGSDGQEDIGFPSLHFYCQFEHAGTALIEHSPQPITKSSERPDDLLRQNILETTCEEEEDSGAPSSGASHIEHGCTILEETKTHYRCGWDDDPETGKSFSPTWEPKGNANEAAVADWEERKRRKQEKSGVFTKEKRKGRKR